MKPEEFYFMNIQNLMSAPSLMDENTLEDLDNLVEIYPYFQTARILHLKNLQKLNDERFPQELPKTALYVPDREKLFHYIKGVSLTPEKEKKTVLSEELPTDTENRAFALIDAFLLGEGNKTENAENLFNNVMDYPANPDNIPLPQKMLASYDYLSFLKNSYKEENVEEKENTKQEESRFQHQELIDNFISESEDGIKVRIRASDPVDLKKDPVLQKEKDEKDDFFSETLAKIYIKQKRYEKALDIIRNLYLKFPEKNIYFADQIRYLELLIENSKTT